MGNRFTNAEFMRRLLDKSCKCAGGKTNENFCAGNVFPAQTKLYSLIQMMILCAFNCM